jgi:O-antigen biosynthesis protein
VYRSDAAVIPRCDIFVVVTGQWHLARPNIAHLIARTTNTNTHIHIVHASSDPFICTELQRIAVVNGARVTLHKSSMVSGPAASFNECLQYAAAPYCLFIGVDVAVSQGAVDELCSVLAGDAGIAVASPLAHRARYTTLPMLPGTNLARMNELIQVGGHSRSVDVPRPEAFCFAVRREVFDTVGCFADLFESQADTIDDFAFRTQQQGYRTVCSMFAYVYRRGRYNPDATLTPARRARSASLLQRRWPARNEANGQTAIESLRRELRSLKPHEFLPCGRSRTEGLRIDDELEILCVLPTLNAYGGVISVVNLLNELSLRGHRCTIVSLSPCANHPHISYAEPDWVEEWADISDRYKADYDIVIATSWETVAYATEIGKKSRGAHCMYFIQDLEDEFYDTSDERRHRVEQTYVQIETRFAKTDYLCRELATRGYPVHRIRPGINLDLFYPRVRPETSTITILAMMRYGQRHRGYDIVLAVLEQVARCFPDVRLILFGTYNLSEANIPFPFENAGRLEPEDLPALYSQADIFLELSRHHGFGRTGIEAMACGAACVLSDSGGIRDYAFHGENALVVPVADVTAATEAIRQLVESPALRDRLVLNGFKTATRWAEAWATEDFLSLVYRTHPAFQVWKHSSSVCQIAEAAASRAS